MIKLSRTFPPEVLEKLGKFEAKRQALSAVGQELPDSVKNGYRAAVVKRAIREETCDKCAYCESKVNHVYTGDVEHILPKSVRPELMFNFSNLTYSCAICNNAKRDYYDATAPLINPYEVNPGAHLLAIGPLVVHRCGDFTGDITEKKLNLNRMSLVERRKERLESIGRLADQVVQSRTPGYRKVLIEELQKECDKCKEYTFVVRAYVRNMLADELTAEEMASFSDE